MFLPIRHKVDWGLILQQNPTQINKDNISEYNKRVDHDYKAGDKVVIGNHDTHKYETPYNVAFVIM